MVTVLRGLDQAETLVFESVTLTWAAVVCEQIEAGGLPARLTRVAPAMAWWFPAATRRNRHRSCTAAAIGRAAGPRRAPEAVGSARCLPM
jgi:hypothetical protein